MLLFLQLFQFNLMCTLYEITYIIIGLKLKSNKGSRYINILYDCNHGLYGRIQF